jgi:hypothetical protein
MVAFSTAENPEGGSTMTVPVTRRDASNASRFGRLALAGVLLVCGLASGVPPGRAGTAAPAEGPGEEIDLLLPPERPDDPPGIPASAFSSTSAAATVPFGRFTSIQVNVNGAGANIVGDAANEPSIAVDPYVPSRIAIGWRQFDTVASNFRQAGYGYSTNGGLTWTTGKIEPGVFRSDPVLGFDAAGKFYYNSLTSAATLNSWVFPSSDGGMTWGSSVFGYGGDKQWMAIDRTGGSGNGQIYQAWSTASNSYAPNTFNRSINAGLSFQSPTFIPSSPVWGTLDVAPDGTLYLVGTTGPGGPIYVARSTDAKNPVSTPTFTTVSPDLGGTIRTGAPNPAGILGQLWIAVDPSPGPRAGWVYVLASVQTPSDPMDVHFIRSTDGGQTWSSPVRVNDDPVADGAWQWFGTMSVSPDGRIDAVWNDTRGTADSNISALYYSYSIDGGVTWSTNEQASPVWNCTVGWPNQSKIGDYYHMVSHRDGADLAWAATFNGEEDIYYLRIPLQTTSVAGDLPRRFRLHPVLPNPFASSTTIHFDMPPAGGRVTLEVFDPGGRRVATLVDGLVGGGAQSARWTGSDGDGRAVRSGIYLCRLESAGVSETRKMMLLR